MRGSLARPRLWPALPLIAVAAAFGVAALLPGSALADEVTTHDASSVRAGQIGHQAATVPDALFGDLAHLNRKLRNLIRDERKRDGLDFQDLLRRAGEIRKAKQEMMDEFFAAETYGVKFSVVFKQLDCLDSLLNRGVGESFTGSLATNEHIAGLFEKAKKCKEKLEEQFRKAAEQPSPPGGQNQPPVINSFGAVFGPPATCSTCTLYTVNASDPEGGTLTYTWSKAPPPGGDPAATNCGTFTPNSPAANQAVWNHPNSGPKPCSHAAGEHPGHITVVVTDAQGASVSFTDPNGSANYSYP